MFDAELRRGDNATPGDPEEVANKGLLLLTALALFGNNSWLDTINRFPNLYDSANVSTQAANDCIDLAPLGAIFDYDRFDDPSSYFSSSDLIHCVRPRRRYSPDDNPMFYNSIRATNWLWIFEAPGSEPILANAFTISAYLATSAWLSDSQPGTRLFQVNYDPGAQTQKPSISLAGILVVSVLIGLNLTGLLATALYARWFPRWTSSLNAFSMLRLGGTISEYDPLKVSVEDDKIRVLDELPGWVGDGRDPRRVLDENENESDTCGKIALGGFRGLQVRRPYEAYDGKSLRRRNRRQSRRRLIKWLLEGL